MTNEQMRETILYFINVSSGIKQTDLAMKVMERIDPCKFDFIHFSDLLEQLVFWGDAVEIEYVINKETKKFYLPKNAVINRIGAHV